MLYLSCTVGTPVKHWLGVIGGTGDVTMTASGSMPDGLYVDRAYIRGTPTTAGEFSFSLIVTDSVGFTASSTMWCYISAAEEVEPQILMMLLRKNRTKRQITAVQMSRPRTATRG